ncbi:hypothetical protein Tco_0840801 [Tanacetum coccineum]|uniref:Uncharacterized protein n=1 Tax=Tanacetum coccineum TaxID=301880 RepID=A0ABQ5AZJ1_9ASTR
MVIEVGERLSEGRRERPNARERGCRGRQGKSGKSRVGRDGVGCEGRPKLGRDRNEGGGRRKSMLGVDGVLALVREG